MSYGVSCGCLRCQIYGSEVKKFISQSAVCVCAFRRGTTPATMGGAPSDNSECLFMFMHVCVMGTCDSPLHTSTVRSLYVYTAM